MTVTTWTRRDYGQALRLLGVLAIIHLVGFGGLFAVVLTQSGDGSAFLSVGLGATAYAYGARHAFDADHIAAIDNTTRKLRADGGRPKSVGFWFAMGHSATVFGLALLVAAGVHVAAALLDEGSRTSHALGLVATIGSGSFLCLIGLLNLVALVGIGRTLRDVRRGRCEVAALDHGPHHGGLVVRLLSRVDRSLTRPWQMVVVGALFGLGFDTATEVAVLVLAGTGAAAGVPWYVVLLIPVLFAAGMSLLDSLDGLFMSVAYDWAFLHPVRKVLYNLTVTGISVVVALGIGMIQLAAVLHDDVGLSDPVTTLLAEVDLGRLGLVIVAAFVLVWGSAVLVWRLRRSRPTPSS